MDTTAPKRRRGRQPLDFLKKMATCTIAIPEELMAKVEALAYGEFAPQPKAAVLRYLINKGLEAHSAAAGEHGKNCLTFTKNSSELKA